VLPHGLFRGTSSITIEEREDEGEKKDGKWVPRVAHTNKYYKTKHRECVFV
jgi:hypothetical protein